MTREQAIAHGKEQLEVFGGEHREFIEMAIKALEQEPTTKNDLGVDCISRADVRSLICKIDRKYMFGMSGKAFQDLYNGMDELPSVTPKKETITYLDGFADGLNMANNSTNKMLDKIRAEIADLDDADYDYEGYYKAVTDAVKIIDKHKAETEGEDA